LSMIIKGDGSWQKKLAAGRCPKCGASVETQLVPKFKKICSSCGLQIIDSKPQSDNITDNTMPSEWEPDMNETKLMPTEEDIAAKEGQMEWSVAVHYVEAAIHKFIVDMRKDPATPDVVLEEDLPNLRLAWNRILRG
jgi:hypothetical protein